MRIFYLDTSSSYLFASVALDDKVLGEVQIKLDKGLSSFTLPEIDKLFSNCNIKPNDIDKIIVVNGPGSFTGVRIGVTIAKIYAWSLKKEITTISSLDAMSSINIPSYDYIIPMIDARRGYVYSAIYSTKGEQILKGQYQKKDTLEVTISNLPGKSIVVTNDNIDTTLNKMAYQPDFLEIIKRYRNKPSINPHAVEPEYLKLTEAEENKI
ncbi:MAG: tRNA (adenosine(37)-N6)-threonylcarbamoyltransferase complex dimerization subunit type 1 TsaB [Bacilli bacterium]